MIRKNLIYQLLLLMTCCLVFVSCKNKSSDGTIQPIPAETPLFYDQQIVNSEFYVNGVVREEMIDTVVNLGSTELPALLFINQKHTRDGVDLENGNDNSNVFRSLTRKQLYDFIILWGKVINLNVQPYDTSAASIKTRQQAFLSLVSFLRNNDLDLPILISLSNTPSDLQCAKAWVDAAADLGRSGYDLKRTNSPDNIFRALDLSGKGISEFTAAVHSYGMSEVDFLRMAQENRLNLPRIMAGKDSPKQEVLAAIALVFKGIKWFSKLTVYAIKKGIPDPDLSNSYASYLDNNDSLVMNYLYRKDTVSPVYKVAYCTLAGAEFYIETLYQGYHQAPLGGQYVTRTGMYVKSITCSWGMRVDGQADFQPGTYTGTETEPIAIGDASVTINYGDCCCVKRTGTLQFEVSGDQGYKQVSWSAGKSSRNNIHSKTK
jgi:hypothetical protein